MNQRDSRELKMIADTVCSVVNVEKIYLFGSFAYGEPKNDSDFDIYVLLTDKSVRPLKAVQTINMALDRIVASKGVSLYERDA